MKAVPCISPPELHAERLAVLCDALDRDGFIVVPAALNDEWVARLRRAFEVAPVPSSGTQHVTITDTTPEVESWRALERHPLFGAGAEHVLGSSHWVAEVHGRNPLPGFGQQGLHPDAVPRAPGEPYSVFTALWMLDDFTPESGATRVVPRSHVSPHPPTKSLAQPLAHHPDELTAVGRAGSVLLMKAISGTAVAETTARDRGDACKWWPDGCGAERGIAVRAPKRGAPPPAAQFSVTVEAASSRHARTCSPQTEN